MHPGGYPADGCNARETANRAQWGALLEKFVLWAGTKGTVQAMKDSSMWQQAAKRTQCRAQI
jgi:hypothetical protein